MYNIFIIGPSRCAKTSIAKKINKALGAPIISASDWVRKSFVPDFPVLSIEDKQKFVIAITEYSLNSLRQDPDVCLKYIRSQYSDVETRKGYVLEGFRSPRDFLSLFDYRYDLVFFLEYLDNPVHGLSFEQDGLSAIKQSVVWMLNSNLLSERQFGSFGLLRLDDDNVNEIANNIINRSGVWFQECT